LKALSKVRQIKKVYAYDIDKSQSRKFVAEFSSLAEIIPVDENELSRALQHSEICVTSTPSKHPFIEKDDILPRTFIAAAGADKEEKQELFPDLLANSKVVADIVVQASTMGELHHAILQKRMTIDDVHAELGEIVSGKKPGRESDDEIIVFDSTGTAFQDVAAAAVVYERAIGTTDRMKINFAL